MKGVFKGFQIPIRRLAFVEVRAQVCGCAIADVLCVAVTSAKLLWYLLEPSQPHTAPSSCSCSRGHGPEQDAVLPGLPWEGESRCTSMLSTHPTLLPRAGHTLGLWGSSACVVWVSSSSACSRKKHVLQRIVSAMVHKTVPFDCTAQLLLWISFMMCG